MKPFVVCIAFLCMSMLPRLAGGQVCSGLPSFSRGAFQVSAGAAVTSGALAYGAGFSAGGRAEFIRINGGATTYSDGDGTALNFSLVLGYQIGNRQTAGNTCVEGFLTATGATDQGRSSIAAVGVTLSYGAGNASGATTAILPVFAISLARTTGEFVVDGLPKEHELIVLAGLGLGVPFNDVLALRPELSVPIIGGNGAIAAGVTFSVSLGRKRS